VFRKGGGTRDQIANIHWIKRKQGNFREKKASISVSLITLKPFDCVDHDKLWKALREVGIADHLSCLLRTCM